MKEVLYATRSLGWGADTRLYRTWQEFVHEFPRCLQEQGARVVKQNRGNGGQGVWKVEIVPGSGSAGLVLQVLEGRRGSLPQTLPAAHFFALCQGYFDNQGCLIDQPFQPRLPDGMIRCYMGADRVIGFGHQFIRALIPPPPRGPDAPEAQPGPRIMHPAEAPEFARLKAKMETDWTPTMMRLLGIAPVCLPVIWDADFLYGPRDAGGQDTYALCEINVSSVFPFPEAAPPRIAELTLERTRARNAPAAVE
ncbi:MAG: Cj0069 family protein [Rhodopila sp.]